MRPRKRAGALLLGAGVLFLIGTSVQAGWLFVIASLLVGATLAGSLLSIRALRGISASIGTPDEAERLGAHVCHDEHSSEGSQPGRSRVSVKLGEVQYRHMAMGRCHACGIAR